MRVFLAAGISGLALHWFNTSQETADVFIDRNLPFLIHHIAHFNKTWYLVMHLEITM